MRRITTLLALSLVVSAFSYSESTESLLKRQREEYYKSQQAQINAEKAEKQRKANEEKQQKQQVKEEKKEKVKEQTKAEEVKVTPVVTEEVAPVEEARKMTKLEKAEAGLDHMAERMDYYHRVQRSVAAEEKEIAAIQKERAATKKVSKGKK